MDRLTEETEALNQAIREVEVELRRIDLGVTASVPLLDHDLAFGKHNSEWRLMCGDGPLLNASRRYRVAAVAKLPALFEALRRTVDEDVLAVRQAAHDAQVFALTLRRGAL